MDRTPDGQTETAGHERDTVPMSERLLFLTGRLAEPRLAATVGGLGLPDGSWRIANIGIKVAALMTEAIVRNRLKPPLSADRVIVPGRSRMDLKSLGSHYGVPFERGPDEIVDLPQYFGRGGQARGGGRGARRSRAAG